jgi:hypothetical protein
MTQHGVAIEQALLATLLYSDLFDFPLTASELSTYLFDLGATEDEVLAAARRSQAVVEIDGLFCLSGRQHLLPERRRRQSESQRQWRKARRYAAWIAALPFVRMVAVTGSLAPGNSRPDDDIDFLLVTAAGRVWFTRLLALAIVRVVRLAGDELCPNFILSEDQLAIDGSAFPAYYARELAQMTPLFGSHAYSSLRLANGWVAQLLPNSNHVRRPEVPNQPGPAAAALKHMAEAVLGQPLFDCLERAEARRKMARLRRRHEREGGVLECSASRCRGHFGGYVERMMTLFELRRSALASTAVREPAAAAH